MQSTVSSSPIQDLNVELVKIYNTNNVKLINSMFVHEIIVFFLFELEQCVKHVFYELNQYTHDVNKKFEYFVSFLEQNYITKKSDAVNTLHKIYDKNSIIECELIAYALDNTCIVLRWVT